VRGGDVAHIIHVEAQQRADLGFRQSKFEAKLTPNEEPRLSGTESIELLFSPNPGEPLKPLRTVASSGEISRLMLAIKSSLAMQDAIPVLVFDEIDANVGGEIANAVGAKMRGLAEKHQVLCITHLPQVAAAEPPAADHAPWSRAPFSQQLAPRASAALGRPFASAESPVCFVSISSFR